MQWQAALPYTVPLVIAAALALIIGLIVWRRRSMPGAYPLLALSIAAGLWSCAVVSAGYAFGRVSEKVMTDASSGLGLAMLLAFLGLSWLLSKRLERVVERT